jgi:hypothetical protein
MRDGQSNGVHFSNADRRVETGIMIFGRFSRVTEWNAMVASVLLVRYVQIHFF